ncbi:Thioesterase/thiol ester dehydrase-isomerase [Stipitochalara longipes BDJ]|nr:Thioesterase/thiol ester dehydrase-isomerase [Stipitochalara longipes BDJ]
MANNTPMTFVDLMALEPLNSEQGTERFMSVNPSFCPDGGFGAAFGGHVYAQSVWAAAQTVGPGMVVHNVHGFFTLPGATDRPYIYEVTHLSEGKSYCTRNVYVRQPVALSLPTQSLNSKRKFGIEEGRKGLGKICFSCICSFKRDEKDTFQGHQGESAQERWKKVLGERPGGSWDVAPGVDAPWYLRQASSTPPPRLPAFPGLDIRKIDMIAHNTSDPLTYRTLSLYRLFGTIPPSLPNIHACAHLYASDKNSLFLVSNALGFGDHVGTMGSLSHSVVFHVRAEELLFRSEGENWSEKEEWWVQEAWTPRSGQGRGMHESKIWSPSGIHVASTWQEGLVRKADRIEDEKQRLMWEEGMRIGGRLGGKGKL